MPSVLIRNATILSLDGNIGLKHGCDILVSDNKIAAISPKLPTFAIDEIIDATDCLVTPGFVNTHHHCWQQILRGVGTDWHLADYFLQMRRTYSGLFTAEDVYISNYVAALDLINNGVTTVVDHCNIINTPHHTDAAIRGLQDAGIRGAFCYDLYENPADLPGSVPGQNMFNLVARKADAERARKEYFSARNDPAEDLITFGGAPGEVEAQSIEQTVGEMQFFRRIGARIITAHVAHGTYGQPFQTAEGVRHTEASRTVEAMGKAGVLGRDLLLSHCTNATSAELSMLKRMGCTISTSPETELQMGIGSPCAFKAKDKGINVSLGLDTSGCGSNDVFAAMRLLLQSERGRHDAVEKIKYPHQRPRKVARKSVEALEIATIGGARALHIDHLVGTICLGKRADLVVTRLDTFNMTPFTDPVGSFIFHANPGNIDVVLVNGKILKRGGELVGIDWPYLRQEIRQRAARIQQAFAIVRGEQQSTPS